MPDQDLAVGLEALRLDAGLSLRGLVKAEPQAAALLAGLDPAEVEGTLRTLADELRLPAEAPVRRLFDHPFDPSAALPP